MAAEVKEMTPGERLFNHEMYRHGISDEWEVASTETKRRYEERFKSLMGPELDELAAAKAGIAELKELVGDMRQWMAGVNTNVKIWESGKNKIIARADVALEKK